MTWNGSGTYNRLTTTVSPATANTTIDVADQNNYTADVATGINACLAKNGENAATGNLPMGGYKHTNVADGTAASDSVSLGQVQDSAFVYEATVGGDGDDITLTLSPTLTAYAAGQTFRFEAGAANTGAVTLNVDAQGEKAVVTQKGVALIAGDITSGGVFEVVYTGTQFILQGTARNPNSVFVNNSDGTPNVSDTGNTITTTVASGVIESIGPTGVATNDWAVLDALPLGIAWIELKIYADIRFTTSTTLTVTVYGKAADSVETFDNFADALLHHKVTDAENAAKTAQLLSIAKVPVDSTNSFDIRWDTAGSPDTETIDIFLSGYGWN